MRYICSASEAIREGIKIWPRQCFGRFYEDDDAACATGAMIGAVLGRALTTEERQPDKFTEVCAPIGKMYNYLKTVVAAPCGCVQMVQASYDYYNGKPDEKFTLYNIAVHLNNYHQWSREQIADWLESEEEKLGFVTIGDVERSQVIAQ